ncbi:MAG: TonB-dependent receptor [Sphingomonas sp.]|uniref:TonB-dependent receptor n=1 Tax=Sphingomonas sp. TaxID=28214 RepID=UPI002274969C|nr:TonB-dependent receptor [Sphingomonas sp.]MCX8475952.1 TonB-dependent receptor [Sphingomonas sp.]
MVSIHKRVRRRALPFRTGLLASAGLAFAAAPAFAQDASAVAQEEQASAASDEIIVTAQKRAENVQDVPIAITALGSEQLSATGALDTEDLKAAAPALNVTTAVGGFGLPRIRGIGATGQGVGIENPVAVYVDGVYYSAAFGVLQSLFDAEQVAVLKGPQGTLFGRNATGGLIQITTRGPDYEWNAKAQFGYGNFETVEGAAYVSGGLSSNVAISLSGQYQVRNQGFGTNVFTGGEVKDDRNWSTRAKLLFEPGATTRIVLSADYNGRDAAEPAFANFGRNTLGQDVPAQIVARGGDPEYDIFSDFDPQLQARQWGVGLTIDQELGFADLKSITAYRKSNLLTFFDPDGTTTATLAIGNHYSDKQFTQEINLVSSGTGPFQWVIGAFYMWDEGEISPRPTWTRQIFRGNYTDSLAVSTLNSLAGFVEGSYSLTDATRLTAGVRYTRDERKLEAFNQTYTAATGAITNGAVTNDERVFEKPSWKVSIDHRFSPEILAYASYNRGFRSGTFVPQATPILVLQPEVVDAYEVGFKTDLFDRRVRFNLAGYYYDQTNVQVVQIIAGTQNVYNAKGARIKGLDGDISVKVTDGLRIFGGFNYTDARYTDFTDAIISAPFPVAASTPPFSTTQYTYVDSQTGQTVANTACLGTFLPPTVTTQAARDAFYRARLGGNCLLRGDASGNRLQNTPEWTFSVGGNWEIPTSIGKFTLAGNVYYNDGFAATPDERVVQPGYTTVDASLTWLPVEHMSVRVWGKNLTDQFYRTQLSASNSGDNGTSAVPRTYGVTLGFDF